MNPKVSVVADEAELSELVHEKADSRSGGADELSQCLLAHIGDRGF